MLLVLFYCVYKHPTPYQLSCQINLIIYLASLYAVFNVVLNVLHLYFCRSALKCLICRRGGEQDLLEEFLFFVECLWWNKNEENILNTRTVGTEYGAGWHNV